MKNNVEKIKAFLIELLQRKGEINLFANYFSRIEENYAARNISDKFENFITDYLSIYSNGKNIDSDDVYTFFRDFYEYATRLKSDENILKHFYRYSNYYLKLLTCDISDIDVKKLVQKINKLGAEDTYPYILEVFEDYEFSIIDKNMFVDILETVVEYAANREFSSNEAVSFVILSKELNKMLAMKNYVPQFEPKSINKEHRVTINELMKQY